MALNKDKVMASAQKLIQQGKLDKAIKELKQLLDEDPKDVRTLLKVGDLYTKKGDRNDATQTYLRVAEFYSEQGFYLKAVAVYKQILRVDPNLVDVNLKLAELYHQLGLMNDSVQQYQLVANVLERQGRTRESLATIKKMVDLDPENVASRIKLAEMYSSQQMPAEAVQEFDTACQQLKKQDRIDDYIKVAERLLFHDANRTDAARELASLYLQRADPKRALAKLQLCFKANSKDVETLVLLAQAFSDLGQTPKAVSVLRELAKVYVERGESAQAEATWRKVLGLAPTDEEARRAVGGGPASPAASGFEDDAPPSFVGAFPSGQFVVASRPASPAGEAAPLAAAPRDVMHVPELHGPEDNAPPAAGSAAPAAGDGATAAEVAKLFDEAEVYARYGRHHKASAHFKRILELDPDHLDARERYKALLIKLDDEDAAAAELVACFRIALSRGESAPARRWLADLASVSPMHAQLGVLRGEIDGTPTVAPVRITVTRKEVAPAPVAAAVEVGGEEGSGVQEVALVVDAHAGGDEQEFQAAAQQDFPPAGADGGWDGQDGSELPAYADGADGAQEYSDDAAATAYAGGPLDEALPPEGDNDSSDDLSLSTSALDAALVAAAAGDDDGFGAAEFPAPPVEDDLPEARSGEFAAAPADNDDHYGGPTGEFDVPNASARLPLPEDTPAEGRAAPPPMRAGKPKPPQDMAEEFFPDELAEAEFFLQQGMADEAKPLLQAILEDVPDSWRAAWMLQRAEAQEAGEPEPPHPYESGEDDGGDDTPPDEGSGLAEVAAHLEDELSDVIPVPAGEEPVQISAEEVLAQFRAGVDRLLSPDDADAHHDLGIAYKEMGLLEDAIAEFERSARAAHKEADAHYLIGLCWVDAGHPREAAEAFARALESAELAKPQQVAIQYELGQAMAATGHLREALQAFTETHAADPEFKDVAERVAAVEQELAAQEAAPQRRGAGPGRPGDPKRGKNIGYV